MPNPGPSTRGSPRTWGQAVTRRPPAAEGERSSADLKSSGLEPPTRDPHSLWEKGEGSPGMIHSCPPLCLAQHSPREKAGLAPQESPGGVHVVLTPPILHLGALLRTRMRRLEPPLGISGALGLFNGVLGGADARGAPWLFWGCLHSSAPAVPMGEPAPARQGRSARARPREMPINSLRTSVSPLCHLALPEKGPVPSVRASCCPTGPVAALWHQEGAGQGVPEVLHRAQKGAGSCVTVSCMFPSQWGLELQGNGVRGEETPLHRALGTASSSPGAGDVSWAVHSRPLPLCPSGLAGKSR